MPYKAFLGMSHLQVVDIKQRLDITSLGIDPQNCSFLTLTMASEKFVCIREIVNPSNGTPSVVVIELENPKNFSRHSINADSLMMNPVSYIIALKSGQSIQLYNIQSKSKLASYNMSQHVVYWRWLNQSMIALVTPSSVYHWNISNSQSVPVKVFDRGPQLNDHTIISYQADESMTFCSLVGLTKSQNGSIVGRIQLFSMEKQFSQALDGHCAVFATYDMPGTNYKINLFSFVYCSSGQNKLVIREISRIDTTTNKVVETSANKFGHVIDIRFPDEEKGDFPISLVHSQKYDFFYLVTKMGCLQIIDFSLGRIVHTAKIIGDADAIFLTVPTLNVSGFLFVTRSGKVNELLINDQVLVPFLTSKNMFDIAIHLVHRINLPGAEMLYTRQFQTCIQEHKYQEAARIAASAPQALLRQGQTINLFKSLQGRPGEPPPILQYFGALLDCTRLNKLESVELVRIALGQNRKDLLEKWLKEDKLEPSEALGNLIQQVDLKLALSVYLKAECNENVVIILAEMGQVENLISWCQKQEYTPDWVVLLNKISCSNPKAACELAKFLALNNPPLIEVSSVIDIFSKLNMVRELTEFAVETKLEDSQLQTVVLELNILQAPSVADAILEKRIFTNFNTHRIAELAERVGLLDRALVLYENYSDQKRLLHRAHKMNLNVLLDWFSKLSVQRSIESLNEMLSTNLEQNLAVAVKVAEYYFRELGLENLVELFESFGSFEGIYRFLISILGMVNSPEIYFKFIESAAQLGQIQEIDRVLRESDVYDPQKVYEFLKQFMLADPRPLITLGEKYGYMEDLIHYFNSNGMKRAIEMYVREINPGNAPFVIGVLLDYSNDEYVKYLLDYLGSTCDVTFLVKQLEERNSLKIIQSWVEARIREGSQDVVHHNTLAKIYIEGNYDPENMLMTDKLYDHRIVGEYCESRNPKLAFEIYRCSDGACDSELVRLCNENGLFLQLARYLIERRDLDLWNYVLGDGSNSENRASLVEKVQFLLPQCSNIEEMMVAIKAFSDYNPNLLISIVEKIIFEGGDSEFSQHANLQNLLILTSIRQWTSENPTNVMQYIKKLEKYDCDQVAKYACERGLYEEAFTCYQKHDRHERAIEVLINDMDSLDKAVDYADQVNIPKVYSILAKAQLDRGLLFEAISNFITANNFQYYANVISACNAMVAADPSRAREVYENKIRYLTLARNAISEVKIDSELLYVYAITGQLRNFEEMLKSMVNKTCVQDLGEKLFHEGQYEAAKIVFTALNDNGRLASTLVKLNDLKNAVEVARIANSFHVWRMISEVCVANENWKLARVAGLNVIMRSEGVLFMVKLYELRGFFDKLIKFLEFGIESQKSHVSVFTELAIAYANYHPPKLLDYLHRHFSSLNLTRVVNICESNMLWQELLFILEQDKLYDKCITVMMEHPVTFNLSSFLLIIPKVRNTNLMYSTFKFFVKEHPSSLNELLETLNGYIDINRIIKLGNEYRVLPLMKSFLLKVQETNDSNTINETLIELFIKEEDYVSLMNFVETYSNFDLLSLAKKLESHPLIEFRRIAAHIYNKKDKPILALELMKRDKFYDDAIKICVNLSQTDAEAFLKHLLEQKLYQIYSAVLYSVYSVVRPDVVLELTWSYGAFDFTFPYLIQLVRDYSQKIDELTRASSKNTDTQTQQVAIHQNHHSNASNSLISTGNTLQLPEFPYDYTTNPLYSDPNTTPSFQGNHSIVSLRTKHF